MGDPVLRIFSYLPNPRIWKATITARLCGLELDLRGASPGELKNWLWDFDARPLREGEREASGGTARQARAGFRGELHKTDTFLEAHPFGTVPAAFSPDGTTGIFESNSIMRAVGRLGQNRYPVYGRDAYSAARIDSFLDASLVFARDSQVYLFALFGEDDFEAPTHARAVEAFGTYAGGIDQALSPDRRFLVEDHITLADICFVAELALFSNESIALERLQSFGLHQVSADFSERYPRAHAHYERLCQHEAFAPEVAPYLKTISERG